MTDERPVLHSRVVCLLIVSIFSAAFSAEVFRILEDNVTDVTSYTTTTTTNNIIVINNNNNNNNNSSSTPTTIIKNKNKRCNSTTSKRTTTNTDSSINNKKDISSTSEYKNVEFIVVRDESDDNGAEKEIIIKADSSGETGDGGSDAGDGDNVGGHHWQNGISGTNSKSGYIIVTYDYGNSNANNRSGSFKDNKGSSSGKHSTRDHGDRNNSNNNDSNNINGESNKRNINSNNNNNHKNIIISDDSRNESKNINHNSNEPNSKRRKHKSPKNNDIKKTKKKVINSLDEIVSVNKRNNNNGNNSVSSSNHNNSKNNFRRNNRTNYTNKSNNDRSYNNYSNNISSIESSGSSSGSSRGKINHDGNINNYGNNSDTSFSKRINSRRRKHRSINRDDGDISNVAASTSYKRFTINIGKSNVSKRVGKKVKTKRDLQFQATQGYKASNNCDSTPSFHGQDLALKKSLCEYEAFIQTVMKCRNIPAVSVAMVKNGEILLSKGFGLADREKGIRNDKEKKFFIGSVTKGFTTTLLAKLLSDTTNITWDTPVKEYIKDFEFTDEERTDHMTLKDMLSHRTGMPGYFQPLLYGFPKNVTRAQFSRMIRYQPALGIFRNTFNYNNYMYVLAAHIAERIANKTWEEMIKDYIFVPLGMKNSGFSDQTEFNETFAMPYVTVHGKLKKTGMEVVRSIYPAGPAGSIYTTPTDMIKWIKFHLEQNSSGNSLDIHPERLKDTYKPISPKPVLEDDLTKPKFPIDDVFVSYNMGWISSVYRGYNRLWHSGLIPPYSAMLYLFPDINAGIFVAINGPLGSNHRYGLKSLAWTGSDILLGEKPWLNTSTSCSYPKPWYTIAKTSQVQPKKTVHLHRPAKDFLGLFCHRGFGNITVFLNQTSQKLNMEFGRYGKLSLRPVGKNEFIAQNYGPLWFLTDSDDNNETMTVRFSENSENEIESILFPVGNDFVVPFVKDMKELVYVSVTMKMATCSAVKQKEPQEHLMFFTAILCCTTSLFLSGIQPGIAIS
ncbi:putative uncharacterized protein DDB_G0282133 [Octopus bimaculoides]|uniref:Beta-lactamase-related domain-containing protein n=1 Tax=Octopus bimaculoides TaxID=37653 RepID=A0A0L8HIC9_OCTBM|nr:putative uncharacterized protein DDB_G0282133 [Octopus bimaculoides]|eukprot:XP_014772360.1 PREDICTED: putative uncharacterized protein DDB_G0282133 [Octopus bimaculoides]